MTTQLSDEQLIAFTHLRLVLPRLIKAIPAHLRRAMSEDIRALQPLLDFHVSELVGRSKPLLLEVRGQGAWRMTYEEAAKELGIKASSLRVAMATDKRIDRLIDDQVVTVTRALKPGETEAPPDRRPSVIPNRNKRGYHIDPVEPTDSREAT